MIKKVFFIILISLMFSSCINTVKSLRTSPNQEVGNFNFNDIDLNQDGNISSDEFLLIKNNNRNDFMSPVIVFVSISIIILILLYFSRRTMEK